MTTNDQLAQVVFTDKARCRDCHRCLRACPVKAIEMHAGQARVVAERCIACGTCVRQCPQDAKHYRDDLDRARRLLSTAGKHCISIAPSFASLFDAWARRRLPSALRQLGFRHVGETAIGAAVVAAATAQHIDASPSDQHICSACPAVVNYIEQYADDLTDRLAPVVSPMIAHARNLRERFGDQVSIIFVGPCVAKKAEAERPEFAGLIDVVLTFEELLRWFEEAGVDLRRCEESSFDESPQGDARYFPLPGGLARTAKMQTDVLDLRLRTATGFEECREALIQLREVDRPVILEPLFCDEGCVNGPGMADATNRYTQRDRLLDYAQNERGSADQAEASPASLNTHYTPRPVDADDSISEADVQATLAALGKENPADQLNCGACGYDSCREKAVAAVRGLAEPEMCIPRMRQLAERRTDRIIETSPNGIVILDQSLSILSMNAAFRRMFYTSDSVLGRPIGYLLDPDPFERLLAGESERIQQRRSFPNYHLTCHQILYALREEEQFVGIFVDLTATLRSEHELRDLRQQTRAQARELLDHQLNMGQQIAKLLGESTARGEALVQALLELSGDQEPTERRGWRDTYTSK